MRIIFFAGKGGVGKTSISAATGVKAAEIGYKTIVMSLDIAHSLSDIFDLEKDLLDLNKGKPIRITDNLWIQELDIHEEINRNWGEIYKYIATLLSNTGIDEVLAEELAILPGMEEISLLLYINSYVRQKKYDLIILDCAPTGESIRFISIPTALEWYMKKIFKLEKRIVKYARPVVNKISDVPMPKDEYFDAIENLFNRLRGVNSILEDPDITSIRLVTNPEKIVLKETQRAFMYFCLYHINIDAIIINRIFPELAEGSFIKGWKERQSFYIERAKEYFDPIPVIPVNMFGSEVLGYDSLKRMADKIYGDRDPTIHFFKGEPYRWIKEDEEYKLIIKLPFAMKKDIELSRISDELIVKVGNVKRHFLLPRQVTGIESVSAKMKDQELHIIFKGDGKDE